MMEPIIANVRLEDDPRIKKVAITSAIVHKGLFLARHNDISEKEALIIIVVALADANTTMMDDLVRIHRRGPTIAGVRLEDDPRIKKVAITSAIVHKGLFLARHNDISEKEALIMIVVALADANTTRMDDLVRIHRRGPT